MCEKGTSTQEYSVILLLNRDEDWQFSWYLWEIYWIILGFYIMWLADHYGNLFNCAAFCFTDIQVIYMANFMN